jgi:hypothetical protein
MRIVAVWRVDYVDRMPPPRRHLLLALLLSACGARSSLEPFDRLSASASDGGLDAGPDAACVVKGAPCETSASCCDSVCIEQICGGPPCKPGDSPVILASGQAAPYSLALDRTAVYFTNLVKAGTVMAVPKAGGGTTPIAVGQDSPSDVAADENAVFWTGGQGFVGRAAKDGTSQVALATGESGPSGIALDAENVYWVDYLNPGKVSAVSKAGGTPTVLATGGTGFSRIAVDAASVTWLDFYGSTVLQVSKGGGAVTTIANLEGLVSDLALDGPSVYVTAGMAVLRIDVPGAPPQVLATTSGDSVYFTDPTAGLVRRVPKLGGEPVTIASVQGRPMGIAADAWCVYWANGGSGTEDGSVMKAPK